MDRDVIQFTRPGYPRACIELDLSHDAPEYIFIKNGKHEIIKQEVVYENHPIFCICCRNLGHHVDECRRSPNQRSD